MQRPMNHDISVTLGFTAPFFRVVDLVAVESKGREPEETNRGLYKVPGICSYRQLGLTIKVACALPLFTVD